MVKVPRLLVVVALLVAACSVGSTDQTSGPESSVTEATATSAPESPPETSSCGGGVLEVELPAEEFARLGQVWVKVDASQVAKWAETAESIGQGDVVVDAPELFDAVGGAVNHMSEESLAEWVDADLSGTVAVGGREDSQRGGAWYWQLLVADDAPDGRPYLVGCSGVSYDPWIATMGVETIDDVIALAVDSQRVALPEPVEPESIAPLASLDWEWVDHDDGQPVLTEDLIGSVGPFVVRGSGPKVWRTSDGVVWEETAALPVYFWDRTATGGRLAGIGVGNHPDIPPSLWITNSGVDWLEIPLPKPEASDDVWTPLPRSVAAGADEVIVVGTVMLDRFGVLAEWIDAMDMTAASLSFYGTDDDSLILQICEGERYSMDCETVTSVRESYDVVGERQTVSLTDTATSEVLWSGWIDLPRRTVDERSTSGSGTFDPVVTWSVGRDGVARLEALPLSSRGFDPHEVLSTLDGFWLFGWHRREGPSAWFLEPSGEWTERPWPFGEFTGVEDSWTLGNTVLVKAYRTTYDADYHSGVWASVDGFDWQRIEALDEQDIAVGPMGAIAFLPSGPGLLYSVDGFDWTPLKDATGDDRLGEFGQVWTVNIGADFITIWGGPPLGTGTESYDETWSMIGRAP